MAIDIKRQLHIQLISGGGNQDDENGYWGQTGLFRVQLMSKLDGVGRDGRDIEVDGVAGKGRRPVAAA